MKKFIGILLSSCIVGSALFAGTPVDAAAQPVLPAGDANRDLVIDIRDVTEIQRIIADIAHPDELTLRVAKNDFSSDVLGIGDATNIQRYLAEFNDAKTREVGKTAFIWRGSSYRPAAEEYQRYLEQFFKYDGTAYVTRNGRVLCQAANGMADAAGGKEMTVDTLFPIASNSKQFCAAAVMMLQEQGKLSVEDKLSKFFPEYEIGKDVTVHQLLAMRSGIRDYVNTDESYKGHEEPMLEYRLSEDNTDDENLQIILNWLFGEQLKFAPGGNWSYSNSNYLLLALIVEQASGMDYAEFIRQNIFEPLGMTNSLIAFQTPESPDIARDKFTPDNPYFADVDFDNVPFEYTWTANHTKGDGDIISNAADMDKWMTSLRECTLLTRESIAAMTESYSQNIYGVDGLGYGYGLNIKGDSIYHDGDIVTFESVAWSVPEENLNIFIVTNDAQAAWEKGYRMSTIAEKLAAKIMVG